MENYFSIREGFKKRNKLQKNEKEIHIADHNDSIFDFGEA